MFQNVTPGTAEALGSRQGAGCDALQSALADASGTRAVLSRSGVMEFEAVDLAGGTSSQGESAQGTSPDLRQRCVFRGQHTLSP